MADTSSNNEKKEEKEEEKKEVVPSSGATESGIPKAPFIDDVAETLKNYDSPDDILSTLQENYRTYKRVESSLIQNRLNLLQKKPEIERSLKAVLYLIKKRDAEEEVKTQYELADNLYAKAVIRKPTTVCLWLGAKLMVEYPLDDARELLEEQLSSATKAIKAYSKDLDFTREQITVTEVCIARVYNYDVKMKRKARKS